MPCLKQAYVANLESYVTDIWKVRPLSHFLLVAGETNTIYSGLILKVALREKQIALREKQNYISNSFSSFSSTLACSYSLT